MKYTIEDNKLIIKNNRTIKSLFQNDFIDIDEGKKILKAELSDIKEIYIPDTIHTIGKYTFSNFTKLERIRFPDFIDLSADGIFANCHALKTIRIPQGTKHIGNGAFENCISLESIELPDSISLIKSASFADCKALKKIILPQNLETVEWRAFYNCISLSEVFIPDSLQEICHDAFTNCKAIKVFSSMESECLVNPWSFNNCKKIAFICSSKTIELGEGSDFFGYFTSSLRIRDIFKWETNKNYKVEGTQLVINDGISELSVKDFFYVSEPIPGNAEDNIFKLKDEKWIERAVKTISESVTEVFIPDSVIKIGDYTFRGFQKLKSIRMSQNLEVIGESAFANGESLEHPNLPESLKSLGEKAFGYCRNLKEINVPHQIKAIEPYTFFGCNNLSKISLPSNLERIGDWAFAGTYIDEITIPHDVTVISSGTFDNCTRLKNIIFPESLERIESSAFFDCFSLNQIKFPDNLHSIGMSSFSGTNLKKIKIPDSVTLIEDEAFSKCEKLKEVYIPKSVKKIGSYNFDSSKELTFTIEPNPELDISNLFENCPGVNLVIKRDKRKQMVKLSPCIINRIQEEPKLLCYLFNPSYEVFKKIKDIEPKIILAFEQCETNKKYLSYLRRNLDKAFESVIDTKSAKELEIMIDHKMINMKNIDKYIDYAAKNEFHEAFVMLVQHKDKLEGFNKNIYDRFELN